MQIKVVHYSALINLGNYNNEKIGFTAELGEGETPEQVIEALRQKIKDIAGLNAEEVERLLYKGRKEIEELERKMRKARQQWDATAEFLRAQGIKTDATDMPQFTHLLPEVKEESTGAIDGDIVGEF